MDEVITLGSRGPGRNVYLHVIIYPSSIDLVLEDLFLLPFLDAFGVPSRKAYDTH
jgi:hypothetical protein